MADKKKRTISIDSDAADLLSRAAGERGGGEYLSRLVLDAYREWYESLSVLVISRGWRREELYAVADALNGYWLTGRPRGAGFGIELHDHARLEGALVKWGLDGDVWRGRIESLTDDDAWHLWVVAREFWRGNRELEAALQRVGSVRPG